MKDDEFKRRLSEVAEWKIPETDYETSVAAKKKRGRKSAEDEYMELREEMFIEEFGGINLTKPPMLTKLKRPCVCDDCGIHCPDGREKEAKLHTKNGKKVWRQKCITCDRFQNPFTGEFNLTGSAASIKFNDFMRETKGAYKTQGNALRKQAEEKVIAVDKTIIKNGQETITFYHDYKQEK